MEAIKIIRYLSPVGEMMIGSYGGNLCICDWVKEKRRGTIDRRICRHLNAEYEEGTSEVIEQAVSQLREYFQGERRDFDIPIVFTGSEFQNSVCNVAVLCRKFIKHCGKTPLNVCPLHPHCNLVAPPLKTA